MRRCGTAAASPRLSHPIIGIPGLKISRVKPSVSEGCYSMSMEKGGESRCVQSSESQAADRYAILIDAVLRCDSVSQRNVGRGCTRGVRGARSWRRAHADPSCRGHDNPARRARPRFDLLAPRVDMSAGRSSVLQRRTSLVRASDPAGERSRLGRADHRSAVGGRTDRHDAARVARARRFHCAASGRRAPACRCRGGHRAITTCIARRAVRRNCGNLHRPAGIRGVPRPAIALPTGPAAPPSAPPGFSGRPA